MDSFDLRLKAIIEVKGMNKSSFAKSLGKGPNGLDSIIVRGGIPRADLLAKILEVYPDVNAHWLLTGEGEMLLEEEGSEASISEMEAIKEEIKKLWAELENKVDK